MTTFLAVSPYEPLQSAFETLEAKKKVKKRPKKGWSSKKKKTSPKKSVAVDHMADVDSYGSLVDEFTDTVKFNEAFKDEQILSNLMDDPFSHLEAEPQMRLGDFMLVSPGEQPPSDPVEPTLNSVDPLSAHSDSGNLNPSDNPQNGKSNDLATFFLFERKNGEDMNIQLNSSGDEQVASLLQEAMKEICSNKIGEMEFRKKNEWIINWRKLRYSESSEIRAVERSAQTVLDYDRFDGAKSETKIPASLACVTLRNISSYVGPTLPRAKVSRNDGHTSVQTHRRESDFVGSPTDDITGHKIITQEPTQSTKIEAGKDSAEVPSNVPERPTVVRTSRIPSGRSGTRNDPAKTNTTISTTLESRKSSVDVPLTVRERSIDDPKSKSQSNSAEHGKSSRASAKPKTHTKRRHTRSKKISSSKRSKINVDVSIDPEKSCSDPTNPEEELASCEKSRDNLPYSSEIPFESKTRPDQDLLVSGSPEEESVTSLDQSSTPRRAIQRETALHKPCATSTSNVSCSLGLDDPDPTIQQFPASCKAQTISSCPGDKLCRTCRLSGRLHLARGSCHCINYQQFISPSDTSSNCNLDKIRKSSIGVQNNADVSARLANQQKCDEHAFRQSDSPQEHLSCQFHRLCHTTPQHVMSGPPCCEPIYTSNCHINPFSNTNVYKRFNNCGSCHQKNAFPNFEQPCVDRYGTPVCNGATHSMGPQVHVACQHQTCRFLKYSPINKFEYVNDSPPNFNAVPSSIPECMQRKVEHASHCHFSHVPLCDDCDDPSNCCETCRRASCYSMGQTLQFASRSSSPNHQAPLNDDSGFQNLKIPSTYGATDNHNASVPSESNCTHQNLLGFPGARNSSQISPTKPCCSVVAHSDTARNTTSRPPICGREMSPSMTHQVYPNEHRLFSCIRAPCPPPLAVKAATTSAYETSSSTTRFSSSNRSHHIVVPCTDEIGSYSRNPTVSSTGLLSIRNRGRPLDLDAIAVTFQEDPNHLTGMSNQSTLKLAPQNIVKKPKPIFPSDPGIPKLVSRFPPENSRRANTTVGKPGWATSSTTLPGTSSSPLYEHAQSVTGGRCVKKSLEPIVISSDDDDDQADGNLGDTRISRSSPAYSGQSANLQLHLPRWRKNTVGQPGQPISSLGLCFGSIDPVVVSSDDDDDDDDDDKGGHNGSLDSMVVLSDDETKGQFDATCKFHPFPENTGLSGNTIDDLIEISSDDDLTDVGAAGNCHSSPENSGQSTSTVGQPGQSKNVFFYVQPVQSVQSIHIVDHRLRGYIDPISISSDDD